jgi:trimeric autotransporter adhesin
MLRLLCTAVNAPLDSTRPAKTPILAGVKATPGVVDPPSRLEPVAEAQLNLPELVLSPAGGTLAVGDSVRFSVLERHGETQPASPPEWTTSDQSVVRVRDDGLVTALRVGTASVTAAVGPAHASQMLHVTRVGVARLVITPPRHAMAVVDQIQLQALAQDGFGGRLVGRVASWSTSDRSVATVSRHGLVVGRGEGSAEITLAVAELSARASVRIGPAVVASVRLAPAVATLAPGETHHFRAAVLNAGGRTIPGLETVWTTSDPMVARVDQQGVVTGLRTGSVRVGAAAGGRRALGTVAVMPRRASRS